MRAWQAVFIAAVLGIHPAMAETEGLPGDSQRIARLQPQQRQMLSTVARNAATASQLGALVGGRGETGRLGELAQAMAMTNSGLAQQLAQVAGPENVPLRERLDESQIARMRALAGNDRAAFGREMVGWITRHYPDTIRNIESLGENDRRFTVLAETALPQLREQLAAAQQLAQAAMETEVPTPSR